MEAMQRTSTSDGEFLLTRQMKECLFRRHPSNGAPDLERGRGNDLKTKICSWRTMRSDLMNVSITDDTHRSDWFLWDLRWKLTRGNWCSLHKRSKRSKLSIRSLQKNRARRYNGCLALIFLACFWSSLITSCVYSQTCKNKKIEFVLMLMWAQF